MCGTSTLLTLEKATALKDALSKARFGVNDLDNLCDVETLRHVLEVLHGYEEFTTKKHLIQCDLLTGDILREYSYYHLKHEVHLGDWIWDESQVELFQPKELKNAEYKKTAEETIETRKSLSELNVHSWPCKDRLLGLPVYDFLKRYSKCVPPSWRKKDQRIHFAGTRACSISLEVVLKSLFTLTGEMLEYVRSEAFVTSTESYLGKNDYFAVMKKDVL